MNISNLIGCLIYRRGIKKNTVATCACCGKADATSCLPFLGGMQFCPQCAVKIMRHS